MLEGSQNGIKPHEDDAVEVVEVELRVSGRHSLGADQQDLTGSGDHHRGDDSGRNEA